MGAKYNAASRNAQVGDGFKDFVLTELIRLGLDARDFREHLLSRGYTEVQANDMEQLEGDIFIPDHHVFLECKTSEKWPNSITVKQRPLTCFSGPHKFYVTSYFDGKNYVDVRVHTSKQVKAKAVTRDGEYGSFCTFDTSEGPSQDLSSFLESLRRAPK
jgi:hypothetical protein